MSENLRFFTFLGFLALFWPFLTDFSKMIEYNRFDFSGTLVHLPIFCLRLLRALSVAWFTQNNFLTGIISLISAVHFSLTTILQYFNLVRFCSCFKLKLSLGCTLQ